MLAIESSCDETAAAVLDRNGAVLADVVHTQVEAHAPYGGVVPEIASREHLARVASVVRRALADAQLTPRQLRAVAATYGPGLIGALLVGLQAAKGMARALGVPLVGVHHIEGHLMAAAADPAAPEPPFIGLVASGGHTALYRFEGVGRATLIGQTRDDAAGEAFDKTAKLLGLGYPGGAVIDRLAEQGDPTRFPMPFALRDHTTEDFSFSGLKTAVRVLVERERAAGRALEGAALFDLCASVRAAIVDALLTKALRVARAKQLYRLVIGGGVAANSLLRSEAMRRGADNDVEVYLPPRRLCTDNAVMIASAARAWLAQGRASPLSLMANADARVEDAVGAVSTQPVTGPAGP
ncbi:MAG: tRNA (adenosine(37)-N6)-threonylcarbamoyltransferase complex transferase subunit TsaD [Deltaproteobacteria bacterium]|nr:tRNA (adenosine(37)-N6)-threonylcarbamoyltransferase complex transferase subunit TsaD [Deltaproteobacteria bacterium]